LEELNKERTKIEKSKKPSYTTAPVSLFQLFANLHVLHTVASSSSRVHDQVFITCERPNFFLSNFYSQLHWKGILTLHVSLTSCIRRNASQYETTNFSINMSVLSKAIVENGERIAKYGY
jgi:hypothetical protein